MKDARHLKLYYVQYTDANGENEDMMIWAFGPASALEMYLKNYHDGDLDENERTNVSTKIKVREIDTGKPSAPMIMTWPEPIEL